MDLTILAVAALVALLGWMWLLLLRGRFWRCDQRLPRDGAAPLSWPGVVAIIPARNEAETIADAVRSLTGQDYPGALSVIVVDDDSDDGTAAVARTVGGGRRIDIISGAPLPEGWSGKLWAVHQGIARAAELAPEARFLLLTDADIAHGVDSLRRLVALAESRTLDLVSLMVRLRCRTRWERLLIPAFIFFFQKLYPFPRVNDPQNPVAGAAGGCMLVRRTAIERIGGIGAIRDRVIDDCALAAAIKPGGAIWLGLADKSRSLRGYDGLSGIWDMVARSAYVQLRGSVALLIGTVLGMVLLYLVLPAALVGGAATGDPAAMLFGGAGWAVMGAAYMPTVQYHGQPVWSVVLLPVAGLVYAAMTVSSAVRTWRGRGAVWKGRAYGSPKGKGG